MQNLKEIYVLSQPICIGSLEKHKKGLFVSHKFRKNNFNDLTCENLTKDLLNEHFESYDEAVTSSNLKQYQQEDTRAVVVSGMSGGYVATEKVHHVYQPAILKLELLEGERDDQSGYLNEVKFKGKSYLVTALFIKVEMIAVEGSIVSPPGLICDKYFGPGEKRHNYCCVM